MRKLLWKVVNFQLPGQVFLTLALCVFNPSVNVGKYYFLMVSFSHFLMEFVARNISVVSIIIVVVSLYTSLLENELVILSHKLDTGHLISVFDRRSLGFKFI